MSLFPFTANSTYQVGTVKVTSATPSIFAQNYAAVPGISTDNNFPLPKRAVVDHHFVGTDIPLLTYSELTARLGENVADPNDTTPDEYGNPKGLVPRRQKLLENAARIDVSKSDTRPHWAESSRYGLTLLAFPATGFRPASHRNARHMSS